jgi:hypothetical protein
MGQRSQIAERVDANARRSGWLANAVRAGLVAYGLVHLLLAWVAVRLTFVHDAASPTGTGALSQLAQEDIGRWTVGAMSVAFCALVLWQLLATAVGYREDQGLRRRLMRAGAAARVVTYAYFAWASAGVALRGPSEQGSSPRSMTARVLDAPAGAVALVAVGCVVAGIGIGLAVFGWRLGFLSQLDDRARHSDRRTPILVIGRIGYVVKGAAFLVIGILLAWAAVAHDPHKTGGLDHSLYVLVGGTAGRIAVIVVGAGIGCFGLYLFARARHLDLDKLTS